ncbi:hypothetical protein LK996_16320 [Lysobacter sp. A6]|uniref:Uncharacterized protein n=1 Tax=Noviluteimonas lactosilytica TaxID=2888523 RepID=A0ABS8JLZ9_9GAMM|nr:hypothetical protein [Lysobacter lactosilyticus]MCC8364637.1 hypothetical protein [Lysobacter lactosilyticus]
MTFKVGYQPSIDEIVAIARARGYRFIHDSLTIAYADNRTEWRFAAIALERSRALSPALLANELSKSEGVEKYSITQVRN